MNWLFPPSTSPKFTLQNRLLVCAAFILLVFSVLLTLSPAVRAHTWQVAIRWQHWIGYFIWLAGFYLIRRKTQQLLPDADPFLLPAAALLSGWGLLTIWRLDTTLGLRQTIWLALSLLAFWLVIRLPRLMHTLRRYKYLWLTASLALTALTFLFGTYPGGGEPRLWLEFGGFYMQPSEPLKLMLIVFLAAYLADKLPVNLGMIQLLLPSFVLTVAALGVLIAQRDLGTATLTLTLYAVMIFQATGKRRVLLLFTGLVMAAGVLGYQVFDVIKVRVDAWLNPWIDPSGRSYQIVQALLAAATGGLGGTGVGLGNPAIVPVIASDFIFTAILEETGLAGALVMITVFAILAGRGMLNAMRAPNIYQRLLASGLVVFMVFQAVLIMGGNLRLFPLTGVTLPFVSYGGSSLVTCFTSIALLVLISSQSEDEPAPLKNPQPLLLTGAGLLAGLMLVALTGGYWALIRSEALLQRPDNPRWSITERYVQRGAIVDRNNQVLAHTTGTPGSFTRQVMHAALSPVIGYTHPVYGKSGLESSMDAYLRGAAGNPSSAVVSANLLYAQTPPGVDVRLALDLTIQKKADALLQGKSGSLVLLNAQSGEILAMASHPTFNANELELKWAEWIKDSRGIFLNRATQGQYPLGGAIGPFLLTEALASGNLPRFTGNTYTTTGAKTWLCAFSVSAAPEWGEMIENGCPGTRLALSQLFTPVQLIQLYQRLGFTETPILPLPTAVAGSVPPNASLEQLALGQTGLWVSPLQVALASASISSGNPRPAPQIATAIRSPLQGWVIISQPQSSKFGLLASASTNAARQMHSAGLPIWQSISTAQISEGEIVWYLAGTLPDRIGTPLALTIMLENSSPSQAREIGREFLQYILLP